MDLISNFAGEISSTLFEGKNKELAPNIDMDDTTFSDLLEKQLNNIKEHSFDISNQISVPSGLNIGEFEGTNPVFNAEDLKNTKIMKSTENSNLENFNKKGEFTTSEILTFFPSLFNNKPTMTDTSNSGLFNFERKIAANSYDKYAKNIVTDLSEFVTDTMKIR